MCAGTTTDAVTSLIRDAQHSNRFKEFKKILHLIGQPIMAITIVKALIKIKEVIVEPDSLSGSSILLSFNNNSLPCKKEHPFSSSVSEPTKLKPMEVILDDHIAHIQSFSSDDLLLCHYSRYAAMLSPTESVEFNNIYGRSWDFDGLPCSSLKN